MIFICYHKEQMLDVEYDILSQKECQLMIDYEFMIQNQQKIVLIKLIRT